MAQRGRTTFQKRQKEMARKEKQQAKAQRREERKLRPDSPESDFTTVEALTGLEEPADEESKK